MNGSQPPGRTSRREALTAVANRLDLRQRSTSRIAGPFAPYYAAQLTARMLPQVVLERLEPAMISLAGRYDFFADFFDSLLEAVMLTGQRKRKAIPAKCNLLLAIANNGRSVSKDTLEFSRSVGKSLVVVLPGADWRRGLDDGFHHKERHWLCLGRFKVPPFPDSGTLVDAASLRGLTNAKEGESVRKAAVTVIDQIIGSLPPRLSSLAATNRTGLENQLTTEISRFNLQSADAVAVFHLLKPAYITVLAGDHDSEGVVASLVEAGCPPNKITVVQASPRLSCQLRKRASNEGKTINEILGLFNIYRCQASSPKLSNGVTILAGTNGRHLPRAADIMSALTKYTKVDLLIPTASIGFTFLQTAAKLFFEAPLRFRGRFIRSHQFFKPPRGYHAPPSRLLLSDICTANNTALAEAVRLGATVFVDHFLLQFLAISNALEKSFKKYEPKSLVLVPGTEPISQVSTGAARSASVRNWQVQTLLTQRDHREYHPIADNIAVIDSFQAAIFRDYFGACSEALHRVGYLDKKRENGLSLLNKPDKATDNVDIIFASQPLPGLATKSVEIIADALRQMPNLRCNLYSHPMENNEQVEIFNNVAGTVSENRLKWAGRGTPDGAIHAAQVMLCLYSNVGIQAAQMGRDVVVIAPDSVSYPVDFAEMGIAIKVQNAEQLIQVLLDILYAGPQSTKLAASRKNYFENNPQLIDNNNTDNFAKMVLGGFKK